LPVVAKGLPGRDLVRLRRGPQGQGKEYFDWLVSTGARAIEGRDILRPIWVVQRDRIPALKQAAERSGVGFQWVSAGVSRCSPEEAARASADLEALRGEFGYIEDHKVSLNSLLFLTASYMAALHDIRLACALGEEALLTIDGEPDEDRLAWSVPTELLDGGVGTRFDPEMIPIPSLTGPAQENYLKWERLPPLYLCSGRAVLLSLSDCRDPSSRRRSPTELLKPNGDRPVSISCAELPKILRDAENATLFRVSEKTIPDIEARLSALGKVTSEEILIEARYEPRRREAHQWYAVLKSELDQAGNLLADTPRIRALVRDELDRLPRYFASSRDPEGLRLLYLSVER